MATGNCGLCDTAFTGKSTKKWCSDSCAQRVKRLKAEYGLSVDQYKALVAATGGRCPICLEPTERWVVDHRHDLGTVTGLVCMDCNIRLLAAVQHNIDKAKRLVEYLSHYPAERIGIFTSGRGRPGSRLHEIWKHAGG